MLVTVVTGSLCS